jgi:CheY-like chemotaxis protein
MCLLYRQRLPHRLTICADGRAAQAAFAGPFGGGLLTQPYLILLDLNMPRMSGLEFPDRLRAQPDLALSIVFIFNTSENPLALARAHIRQIAGYLAKSRLGPGYAGLLPVLAGFELHVGFSTPSKSTA